MIAIKALFIGLICGAVLTAIVVIIISKPSSFFLDKYSFAWSEKKFARGALLYLTLIGATVGAAAGFIIGLIIAFIHH